MLQSSKFLFNILSYLEGLREKEKPYGQYRYGKNTTPTYWSSAYVALIRSLFGELITLSFDEREQWRNYLLDGQDEKTGLFIEPTLRQSDLTSKVHPISLITWHGSTFVNGAIHTLGGIPKYPIAAINKLKEKGKMIEYLEQLPWDNPWLVGNYTYDIGSLMGVDYQITGDIHNLDAMNEFFKWHELHQNKEHGFWDISETNDLAKILYGGYHSLMVYWMYDKPIPYYEKMIKTAINVFNQQGKSIGSCQDMDILDTAISLSRQYDVLEHDVRVMTNKLLPELIGLINEDGGICSQRSSKMSDFGWKNHMVNSGESALTSTYFTTYSLSLIEEMFEIGIQDIGFHHMDSYCHGVRPKNLI